MQEHRRHKGDMEIEDKKGEKKQKKKKKWVFRKSKIILRSPRKGGNEAEDKENW